MTKSGQDMTVKTAALENPDAALGQVAGGIPTVSNEGGVLIAVGYVNGGGAPTPKIADGTSNTKG